MPDDAALHPPPGIVVPPLASVAAGASGPAPRAGPAPLPPADAPAPTARAAEPRSALEVDATPRDAPAASAGAEPFPLRAAGEAVLRRASAAVAGAHTLTLTDGLGRVVVAAGSAAPLEGAAAAAVAPVRLSGGAVCAFVELVTEAEGASSARQGLAELAADGVARELAVREAQARLAAAEPVMHLSTFLAHELASPVSLVLGLLQMLTDQPLDGPADDLAGRAYAAAAELAQTVHDLRGLSGAPPAREIGVAQLLADAVELLPRPPGVSLTVDVSDVGLRVRGQVGLLRHALRNLVRNALDAVGESGTVEVQARSAGGRVRIAVSDDGPGVSPEHLIHVFRRPFTTRAGGSGVGLLLVRTVVETVHGGSASLRMRAPHGSIFAVELPGA